MSENNRTEPRARPALVHPEGCTATFRRMVHAGGSYNFCQLGVLCGPLVFTESAPPPLKRVRVTVPADVGQVTSVKTACGAEDAEPLMEASAFQE